MAADSQIRFIVRIPLRWNADIAHTLQLRLAWSIAIVFLGSVITYGYPYYLLALEDRPASPFHALLRPSGYAGIRLGLLGLAMFGLLFLYPIRKRWPWLSRKGKTKHWLDFHIFLGITAPIVITLHSSLKLRGIAGVAYWIMMAVSASGFVGRYLYGQIPRTVHAADLTLREIEEEIARLTAGLQDQMMLTLNDLRPLLSLPSRESASRMGAVGALCRAFLIDVTRPFQIARLRWRFLTPAERFFTLGGLLSSSHGQLETALRTARAHAWMSARLLFLTRMQEIFHLWHVVHRPFSLAFIVLVVLHITVALLFGYYR